MSANTGTDHRRVEPVVAEERAAATAAATAKASAVATGKRTKAERRAAKLAKAAVVEARGLSITERFFFKTPASKPQVLMCIALRIRLPQSVRGVGHHTAVRVVDLLRLAQAQHYRLASYIDQNKFVAVRFADTADKLPTAYRLFERSSPNGFLDVYSEEINTNFDTTDTSRPLWRTAIILPKNMMPAPDSDLFKGQTPIVAPSAEKYEYPILYDRAPSNEFALDVPAPTPDSEYFEIMFTFHHCLGDGLSMFAFARTFLTNTDAAHFNAPDLDLAHVPVSNDPPPVIDNLFNPNIFEVFPTAAAIAIRTFAKKNKRLGHGADTAPAAAVSRPLSNPNGQIIVSPAVPARGYTNSRALTFDTTFMATLRKRSKEEKTSIAAVLVVAALTACRNVFAHIAERDAREGRKTEAVPDRQGWVVTNSIRHILPQSRLLQGGDRETDEGLKVFGGYAGSVSNNSLKLADNSSIWERCRVVKKGITTSFIASIRRLKVANYVFRHPKLTEMLEKKTDLSKLSQSYSVEVANLGAWEYPCAPPNAPETDERVRLDYFGGGLSASFEGSRGLFSLGIITLGGFMTVFVSYDTKVVTVDEAEVFFKAFARIMHNLGTAGHTATVGDVRK